VPEGADVVIRYQFLPTTDSIRQGAEKAVKEFDQKMRKTPLMPSAATAKRFNSEWDKTVDSIINFLRATQQKTSLQTKIMAGLKLLGGGGGREAPSKGAWLGEGGGGGGGIAAAPAGGGGGMMTALGTIAGILVAISVATALIAAFFEAVGPFIKVVFKLLSAIMLILLVPFLKRIMPLIAGFFKWLIENSKMIADGIDKMLSSLENLVGRAMGGDLIAWIELMLAPFFLLIGPALFAIFKAVTDLLQNTDWTKVLNDFFAVIIPVVSGFIGGLFSGDTWSKIKEVINLIGTSIFGETIWTGIKNAIHFIQTKIFPEKGEGVWYKIMQAINWIWNEVFGGVAGGGLWGLIQTALSAASTMLTDKWASIGAALSNALDLINNALKVPGKVAEVGGGLYQGLVDFLTGKPKEADFISRPGSGTQAFSSDDTIIGMKNPGALGGTTINNYLTVSAGVDRNEFRKILSDFNREQAKGMRSKTSYFGGSVGA
jgi:hypothetical protein